MRRTFAAINHDIDRKVYLWTKTVELTVLTGMVWVHFQANCYIPKCSKAKRYSLYAIPYDCLSRCSILLDEDDDDNDDNDDDYD